MKLKSLAYATGLAVVMLSGAAHALPFLPLTGIFEDDNKERVIDSTGAAKTSGSLVAGDTLIGIVKFNSVLNLDSSVADPLNPNFVYGISAITIDTIVAGVATFKPNAAFVATYGAGAMAAFFTSGTGLNLACATIAACEGAAAGGATFGTPYLTVGLVSGDDFWIAGGVTPFSITTPLEAVAALGGATKVAVANYALSVISNGTGYTFLKQACPLCAIVNPGGLDTAQIIGSGDVLGGLGLAGPYLARSDFDFTFQRVPEPGTLALLGMGLLGMGWSARRRLAK